MNGFDVVVVGAGAAGCVVASRLAEAGRTVLLLEAGPDLRADVPADFRDGWAFPRREEWGYESEPDDRGQTLPLRRGRLVGGTSWVTRFGVRGSPADFAAWERLGCRGWGFDDVLPWFQRRRSRPATSSQRRRTRAPPSASRRPPTPTCRSLQRPR